MESFKKYCKGYENIIDDFINEYGRTSGNKIILPEEFEDMLLQQYIAYRNELTNRKLVFATWFLAGATIILSGITLFLG